MRPIVPRRTFRSRPETMPTTAARLTAMLVALLAAPEVCLPQAAAGCFGGLLEWGEEVTVRTVRGDCGFALEGEAGQAISLFVRAVSPGLDPLVRLIDPYGRQEAFDDDSGGEADSLIEGHTLLATGRYTVLVETEGLGDGEIAVVVEPVQTDVALVPSGCFGGLLEPGEESVDWLPPEGCDWALDGEAGDVVTLTVRGATPGLDPRVALVDPDGDEEASDDDSLGDGNARIASHRLSKSGRYTVVVESDGGAEGEVVVLLEAAAE